MMTNETSGMETETSPSKQPDVYTRLYDRRSYTGVYRKRFENDCYDLSECVVHDLSNTMRPNLNYDVDPKTRRASSPRLSIYNASEEGAMTPSPEKAPAPAPIPAPAPPSTAAPCPSPEKLQGDPNDPHTLLKAVFHYYCRFGRTGAKGADEKTMDNANFSKLCRECPDLLDADFTRTDVDLIFVKAKKKGERRINYTRFLDALGMIAIQKYADMTLETSVPKLLEMHIAKLPCVMEFTDGKVVQAVWLKRAELIDNPTDSPPSPQENGTMPPPAPQ